MIHTRICVLRQTLGRQRKWISEDEGEDPLQMKAGSYRVQVDADPFAPPGTETKKVYVTLPTFDPMLSAEPGRIDLNDPSAWSCDKVVEWVKDNYSDPDVPEIDKDLIEAFHMGGLKGKDLLGCYPNTMFKEMRKKYQKPDYIPNVTEELVRETLLLSYKYGGQDSMW
eukprot:TRINITY_DN4500_c0_g1_i1.p1 TRINITY_DN4500_c0_g1~~TRINITY_DN4500_c0_g1_i1.p1  ORF type:complete len:190 (+),score=30.39 TRINITY_DN4500_c0_g1_i1:67-570(+)